MKQISSFVNEISDEFKIVVVQTIKSLCLKFPKKHGVLMNFLSGLLRDEGTPFESSLVNVPKVASQMAHIRFSSFPLVS
jgi:coatomer protein complex subunit gamma